MGGIDLPRIDSCRHRRNHIPPSPQRRHLSFLLQDLGGEGDSHPCPGHHLGDHLAPLPPPLPQGVNRLKNPPPTEVIVSVISYVPLELPFFLRCCVETLSIHPCFGEALSNTIFLTTDSFCFSFLEIFREVWSSEPHSQGNIHRHQHGRLIE